MNVCSGWSSRPGARQNEFCSDPYPPPVTRGLAGALGTATPRAARAGLAAAAPLARSAFRSDRARALFAGNAAHSMLPLEQRPSAAFGLVLSSLAHTVGWPFPCGGAQRIADALAGRLRDLGGTIYTTSPIDKLPHADVVLADVMPGELLRLAQGRLPTRYARQLIGYRHGPGAFKLDWALSGPIPWRAREDARAGTVHLGGTLEEISTSERAAWSNRPARRPFVLLAQPSLFDPTRAPPGNHVAWAYCHVPNGYNDHHTAAVEEQIERFAPGFRDLVLARSVHRPSDLQRKRRGKRARR